MEGWVTAVITSVATFLVWLGIFLYRVGKLEGKIDELSERVSRIEYRVNNVRR